MAPSTRACNREASRSEAVESTDAPRKRPKVTGPKDEDDRPGIVTLKISPLNLSNIVASKSPAAALATPTSSVTPPSSASPPSSSTSASSNTRASRAPLVRKPKARCGKAANGGSTPNVVKATRPERWGEPEVWAESRPELCEALPYFKSRQGSTYSLHGIIRGKLLDFDHGERSYMDEEVIITRCGGGMEQDEARQMVQKKDITPEDPPIKCYLKNKNEKIPLQLIIGNNNVNCPTQIPHRYCVMGSFHITDVWSEKSNGMKLVKVRMEKVDLERKSWWATEGSKAIPLDRKITETKAIRHICAACNGMSPVIFEQGWICLNYKCGAFWSLNGCPIDDQKLTYNPAFVHERTIFDGFEPPYSTVPKPLDANLHHSVGKQCWAGMVCPNCRRCIQRVEWDAWKCHTDGCGFTYTVPHKTTLASSLLGDLSVPYVGHALSDDTYDLEHISFKHETYGLWRIHIYEFMPGVIAFHYHANELINAKPGGAHDILCALQTTKLDLQRRALKCSVVPGTYSNQFTKNLGLPYNYVVGQDDSVPFSDTPNEVREVLRRTTWAAKRLVGNDEFTNFNEMLAVGYFGGGKMGYHDDGEDTLGPTVMSISFGSPATMHWRMKYKYFTGFTSRQGGKYDPTLPVLPGCYKPDVRRELNEKAHTMSSKELTALANQKIKCSQPRPMLTMKLRHGDFMGMHGAALQKYYEHEAVNTEPDLRFALTCRHVKPDMIPEELHGNGDIDLDPAHPYDGDLELYDQFKLEQRASLEKAARKRTSSTAFAA